MKVLHVVPTYYPAFKYGGPIHSTHLVNKKLVEKQVDVTVYTTMDGQPESTKEEIETDLDGVKVYYFKSFKNTGYGISWSFIINLIKNIKNYDVVLLTSVFTFTSFVAPLICLIYRKPFVISSRGTLDPLNIDTKSSFIKKLSLSLYERYYLNKAASIIVLMEDEQKWLIELNVKNSNVVVIPNGMDCIQDRFITKKAQNTNNIKLLYLGRLNYKKNIDIIIQVYSELKKEFNNLELTIAGPDDGMEKELKRITKELNLENDVYFSGLVTGKEKIELLSNADIFILPSISEGISMAQLEAMCAQCAVVVGNRGGIHEELSKYNAGIVIEPKMETLSTAVRSLIVDEKLRSEIVENGFNLVKNSYTWKHVIEQYILLYQTIINKSKKRS